MTLNLHEDSLILCEHGARLGDNGLDACHPLS